MVISIVSAFRSVERQGEIVRAKLAPNRPVDRRDPERQRAAGIQRAPYGPAVDVTTDGVRPLELEFEGTAAFAWLSRHAGRFGFVLSYPRQNRYGYLYEPWHWCFSQPEVSRHA